MVTYQSILVPASIKYQILYLLTLYFTLSKVSVEYPTVNDVSSLISQHCFELSLDVWKPKADGPEPGPGIRQHLVNKEYLCVNKDQVCYYISLLT